MAKWLALASFLAVTPYWEPAEPKDWADKQLMQFFGNSPWALPAQSNASSGVLTFLATARPVQDAEVELHRRRTKKADLGKDAAWEEYQEFLARDAAKYI